ncbi:hypothetical protein [Chitinophaga rhizosphaerae]|uniref:hypothetical protein n=1 Tax=Chitinophaga rhizosphaerae TaxID=1864947 RepID=UPI000F80A79E|nr:hypothetical protein [Chitinophaga rhizosphaerae]
MKYFIIPVCLLIILSACSKKKAPGDETPNPHPFPTGIPLQSARGATIGPAVTAVIGAGGGTLSSADGRITLIIPAGAVTTAQTFSIQPVENTLRPGYTPVAPSFRLLPENGEFAKPVTVKIKYDPEKLTSGVEDGLRMAYQSASGHWKPALASLDKAAHTLTAQVLHFCDVTFYEQFELFVDKNELGKGEKANLAVGVIGDITDSEDLLVNFQSAVLEQMYGQTGKYYMDIGGHYITRVKGWKLVKGGGVLTPKRNLFQWEANAEYTAPDEITRIDTAIVEVTLEGLKDIPDPSAPGGKRKLGTLIIRKEIRLVPDGYIQLRVNGKDHLFTQSLTAQVHEGLIGIGGNFNHGEMGIGINVGSSRTGTFSCENPLANNGKAQITWAYRKGDVPVFASSMYCVEEGGSGVPKHSAGTLKLTKVGALGEFVEGEFSGTIYEQRSGSEACDFDQKQVAIRFRLRRTL